MQSTRYLNKFCEKLVELVSKLEDRFPNERDFGLLYTGISIGLKGGQHEYISQQYYNWIYNKYRQAISEEDIEFFLNCDYTDTVKENKLDKEENVTLKIDHFKNLLSSKTVTDKDKKIIWSYLKLLNKLMDGIIMNNEVAFT